ncbi:MAG: YtxH domain-containing protein [Parafilimonas sp.]
MSTQAKILVGIIGAAAAGAIIGMLCAPEKGSDLRKRVSTTTNDLICQLADLFTAGKNKINAMASDVESGINSAKENLI